MMLNKETRRGGHGRRWTRQRSHGLVQQQLDSFVPLGYVDSFLDGERREAFANEGGDEGRILVPEAEAVGEDFNEADDGYHIAKGGVLTKDARLVNLLLWWN